MNVVLIVGNLTRDPEMRYTSGGKAITEFTVAVNRGSGEKRVTTYIRCEAWEKVAESVAERARKGSKVAVEGELKVDTWKDSQTGKNREKMLVNCRSVAVMAQEGVGQEHLFTQPARTPNVPQKQQEEEENFDDLPF